MASVSLNAIHYYQPASLAGRPVKGPSTQRNRVASTQPSTRPVFKKPPPKLPAPPPLSDDELAAREALRRRGWPKRFSPVSKSSHYYPPESGVLSTNRGAEGSASGFPSIRVRRSC